MTLGAGRSAPAMPKVSTRLAIDSKDSCTFSKAVLAELGPWPERRGVRLRHGRAGRLAGDCGRVRRMGMAGKAKGGCATIFPHLASGAGMA